MMRAQVVYSWHPLACERAGDREIVSVRKRIRVSSLAPSTRAPVLCVLNGRPILRAAWRQRVQDGDCVSFICLPSGGGGGGSDPVKMAALLALTYFTMGAGAAAWLPSGMANTFAGFVLQAGVFMVGSAVINALLPPPSLPSAQQAADLAAPSPTYSLGAQGNSARIGQAIPELFGRHLIYPDFAATPYAEFSSNEQYLYQLFVVSRGEVSLETIRIEDTEIGTFEEVETQIVLPGERVTLFPANVVSSSEVAGQTLVGAKSGTYRQSGMLITVTSNDHGLSVGDQVVLIFTSGGAVGGEFSVVYVPNVNTLTFSALGEVSMTGNVDLIQDGVLLHRGIYSQTGNLITVTAASHGLTIGELVNLSFSTGKAVSGEFSVVSVPNVNTLTVTTGDADTKGNVSIGVHAGPYVAVPAGMQAVRLAVDVVCPRGLFVQSSSGAMGTASISLRFEARLIDADGAALGDWIPLFGGDLTISGATTTAQRRSFIGEIGDLVEGRYEVRAARLDVPSTSVASGHEVAWAGLRCYVAGDIDFGDVTLLAMRIRASNQISSQASRRVNVVAQRLLPVWSAGTGWSAPVPTRSIAWALAYLCKTRLPDSRVDLAKLAALDADWAARGDFFDGVFDSKITLSEALTKVARAGRARYFEQGGVVRFARDRYQALPVGFFSDHNICKGSFSREYKLPSLDAADGVKASYFRGDVWRSGTVKVVSPGRAGDKLQDLSYFGMTDRGQVWREASHDVLSARYRRVSVSFEVEGEGAALRPLDRVDVVRNRPGWGQSAFVVDWVAARRLLVVNQPLLWSDGAIHYCSLALRNGGSQGPFVVTRGYADDQIVMPVTFVEALAANEAELPFFGANAEPTRVAFGAGVDFCRSVVVDSVQPLSEWRFKVAGFIEDDRVHADPGEPPAIGDAGELSLPSAPVLSGVDVAVSGVASAPTFALSWSPAAGASHYLIEESQDGVIWDRVGEAAGAGFVYSPSRADVLVRVAAVGLLVGPWVLGVVQSNTTTAAALLTADGDLNLVAGSSISVGETVVVSAVAVDAVAAYVAARDAA